MKSLPKILLVLVFTFVMGLWVLPSTAKADVTCPTDVGQAACDIIVNLFTTSSETQGPWYNQNPQQFAKKVFGGSQDEIFGERYTFAQINWIINSIAAMLNPMAGISDPQQLLDFLTNLKELITMTTSGVMPSLAQYSKLGPIGAVGGGMSMIFSTPPASGTQEIKYTAQKIFDFGTGSTPAYAQGYGYTGLNSSGAVHSLWTATRNMSYLIIVILLIASGFLIMFRIKINPQTVVSLQTMIPKLIITMVLVTFSFAIAGLIIDLIYVFILLFIGMLGLSPNLLSNPTSTMGWLTTHGFMPAYVGLQIGNTFMLVIFMTLGGLFLPGIGGLATLFTANILFGLIGAIIGIALAIWMFVILAKIFFMLVKSYVTLILLICIGPLQIMLDLIPGQKGFGPWVRSIIANASVFVVVPVMLILQHIFLWNPITNNVLGLADINALGNVNLALPFFKGALNPADLLFRSLIGYTIFSMTPKIAEIIRDALKIPPFKHGADFGGVALVTKPVGGTLINVGKNVADPKLGNDALSGGIISGLGESISSYRP